MKKRFLDCNASDFIKMNKEALIFSLKASEGRILASETVVAVPALLNNVTNAELAASQGADLLLLNLFDVEKPFIYGMPTETQPENMIRDLQRLTGRVIGVNLEAVDSEFASEDNGIWQMKSGRLATVENAKKLVEMGAQFIVLTGNPGTGVSLRALNHSLKQIKQSVGDQIILVIGKMHAAGVIQEGGGSIVTQEDVNSLLIMARILCFSLRQELFLE